MKTKPILFSTQMVEAILQGSKKQTRRPLKLQPDRTFPPYVDYFAKDWNGVFSGYNNSSDIAIFTAGKCPFGNVGDVLWVRETFSYAPLTEDTKPFYPNMSDYIFKANSKLKYIAWKPSIHMPKKACRLFLKITNVKIERLQSITQKDAFEEGLNLVDFANIWIELYGQNNFDRNPFVWVIQFEKTEKPENF